MRQELEDRLGTARTSTLVLVADRRAVQEAIARAERELAVLLRLLGVLVSAFLGGVVTLVALLASR